MEGAHGWFDFGARGDVVGDIVDEGGEGDAPRVCLCSGLGVSGVKCFFVRRVIWERRVKRRAVLCGLFVCHCCCCLVDWELGVQELRLRAMMEEK